MPCQKLASAAAQQLQDDRVVAACLARCGDRSDQHHDAGGNGNRGGRANGERDAAEQLAHLPDHVAGAQHGDRGKRRRDARGDRAITRRRRIDAGEQAVRRFLNIAGREDERKVQPHALPIDLAQRRDARRYLDAEDRNGDRVADLQTQELGGAILKRDQGRTAVIGRPPFAGDHRVAGRHRCRPGDGAIAAQDPGALR